MAQDSENSPHKTPRNTAAFKSTARKPAAPLVAAIDRGADIGGIYRLLEKGANPVEADARGRTPMDAAMARQDYDIAALLLRAGAHPPAYDGDPNGPPVYDKARFGIQHDLEVENALTYFVKKSHGFETAFRAIANGADVNKPNNAGHTPLAIAVSRKWPYAATQLVKLGAYIDPETRSPDEIVDETTGATRLLAVIMEGRNAEAVWQLLEEGANPNLADRHGLTPLALSRALRWTGVEKMLLDKGAAESAFPDANQMTGEKKDTPLLVYSCSYQNAHENYKRALLNAGADPDARDASGKTAAHWCAIYGRTHMLQQLGGAGADLTTPDTQGQLTPLHWACYNGREHAANWLLKITPAEALNAPNPADGKRLLHYTANRAGTAALIDKLVDAGALVNLDDNKGATPLDVAVQTRDPEAVRALLENGADTAKIETGRTRNPPLFTLVNSPNEKNAAIARLLLDHGANPNAVANESYNGPQQGDHLLYFAISYRNLPVAEALLNAGADPHATDAKGQSAMHYCLNLRQEEGLELLLKHGFDVHKHFDYTQKWHGGGTVTEERHEGSSLDEARRLVEKFGADDVYGRMLRRLEAQAAAQAKPHPPRQSLD